MKEKTVRVIIVCTIICIIASYATLHFSSSGLKIGAFITAVVLLILLYKIIQYIANKMIAGMKARGKIEE